MGVGTRVSRRQGRRSSGNGLGKITGGEGLDLFGKDGKVREGMGSMFGEDSKLRSMGNQMGEGIGNIQSWKPGEGGLFGTEQGNGPLSGVLGKQAAVPTPGGQQAGAEELSDAEKARKKAEAQAVLSQFN